MFQPVPDGYRLVIHDVAGMTRVFQADPAKALSTVAYCSLQIRDDLSTLFTRIIPTGGPIADIPGSRSQIEIFSEPVVVYAEAGQHPEVGCLFTPDPESDSIEAYIAGILVPVE